MLYKNRVGAKSATLRQAIYCTIWGFITGIYVWQPLLKFVHPDEESSYTRYFTIDDLIETRKPEPTSSEGS